MTHQSQMAQVDASRIHAIEQQVGRIYLYQPEPRPVMRWCKLCMAGLQPANQPYKHLPSCQAARKGGA
jgi:hypothetical protein